MSEENSNETLKPSVEASTIPVKEKRRYAWLAIASLFLCIGSWAASTYSGYLTLAIGVAAIVSGAFSLGSHRAAVRNTAITSIIATGVLLLVVGAFMIALHKLLQ